jgi:transposase
VKQTRYDWVHVLAAVCPDTGQAVGLLSPTLNTDAVNSFFKQFSQEVDPEVHVVMLWDQAGFHTSGKVKLPPNVTVIELPPKSPELNPVENLWHYLRSHHWANRAYADYAHLRQAACDAWHESVLQPSIIHSVCAADYASVN